ncbi:hypothetical protein QOT17_004892 [Balamuthia mandrillaris]
MDLLWFISNGTSGPQFQTSEEKDGGGIFGLAYSNSFESLRCSKTKQTPAEQWISYTELLEVYERMEKEVWKPLLEKALEKGHLTRHEWQMMTVFVQLKFCMFEVPLRLKNLYNMEIGGKTLHWKKETKTYKVFYHHFKSANQNLPPYSPELGPETSAIMRVYQKVIRPLRRIQSQFFFCNTVGKQQTRLGTRMSLFMYKFCGINGITPGKIRAAIATAAKEIDLPDELRRKLARAMLHSFNTHETHYTKVSAQQDHMTGRQIVQRIRKTLQQGLNVSASTWESDGESEEEEDSSLEDIEQSDSQAPTFEDLLANWLQQCSDDDHQKDTEGEMEQEEQENEETEEPIPKRRHKRLRRLVKDSTDSLMIEEEEVQEKEKEEGKLLEVILDHKFQDDDTAPTFQVRYQGEIQPVWILETQLPDTSRTRGLLTLYWESLEDPLLK